MRPIPTGGPKLTPAADHAALAIAVVMMLGGAALMLADVLDAALAIPVIAVGIALVAIEQAEKRRPRS
jgi:hypothetical protein